MWWLYNEGGVYDDVDSYDSGDDDRDHDFDLQEWWWALERGLPAGVATSQTEVMNSDVLKYKLIIADTFRQRKEKKRKGKAFREKKLATSFPSPQIDRRYDDGPWKARA